MELFNSSVLILIIGSLTAVSIFLIFPTRVFLKKGSKNSKKIMGLILSLLGILLLVSNKVQNNFFSPNIQLTPTVTPLLADEGAKKYFSDGISAATNGQLDLAIFFYKKALEINPNYSDAYHFLGYAEFAKWHNRKTDSALLSQAKLDLEKSLTLNPQNTWALYNYSIILWWAKDRPGAIQQIKILLGLDPSFKERIRRDGQFKPFKDSKEFMNLIWK